MQNKSLTLLQLDWFIPIEDIDIFLFFITLRIIKSRPNRTNYDKYKFSTKKVK